MKAIKPYSIVLAVIMLSQQSVAQLANFYSSPGYSSFVNNMISNSIWKSAMDSYTKEYKGGSTVHQSDSSNSSVPEVVPEYRQFRAVQFKPTGTRLTLQEYLDAVDASAKDKEELKELILKIFKDYEAAAAQKGLANDWALAYVSCMGLNNLIYYGHKEKPILPFEQNVGLRDVVAETATDNGLFKNITDNQKQQQYELLIILGALSYHYYEKACKENNVKEIENCKLGSAQILKMLGVMPR
jgi:uncharacterized protein DUF6683